MIFGIGPSKSGTHSLHDALSLLGLRSLHVGHEEHLGNASLNRTLVANHSEGRPILQGIECDAIADWPIFEYWQELAEQYPDSSFILTYRPPEDCALSWSRMLLTQPHRIQPDWCVRFDEYVGFLRRHYSLVLQWFLRSPERLLVLDMRDDDSVKWTLLARFVRRPRPRDGTRFPRSFDHAQWQVDESQLTEVRESGK